MGVRDRGEAVSESRAVQDVMIAFNCPLALAVLLSDPVPVSDRRKAPGLDGTPCAARNVRTAA
jgi:hypothetical protein